MIPVNSPVESAVVDGQTFYIKRDDLLHRDFSGNKARKLYYLLNQDLSQFDKIIGFGSPQANSLHSLAVLAKMRKIPLDYYVGHVPSILQSSPAGNYQAALANGANIIAAGEMISQGKTLEDYVVKQILPKHQKALFVPEGGRYQDAAIGVNQLADEIIIWLADKGIKALNVFLPAGTGTTALFLQKRFVTKHVNVKVLTCACVGGDGYLKKQFHQLEPNEKYHPTIINDGRKYHFGKLYEGFYQVWLSLKQQTKIEFDMLYDPQGWIVLREYRKNRDVCEPVMYVHQGGILGNETMLPRYERKFAGKL